MTAPDSRDSVERVVAEMRDAAAATSDHYEAQSLRKFARRLQALARGPQPTINSTPADSKSIDGPQQAGGEDGEVLCHKLHTSDGKKAWRWVDGPPNEQAQDDARNFGWELELAYSAKYVAALQAEVARLQRALNFCLPTTAQVDPAFAEQVRDDAMLLMGYTGEGDALCYHDQATHPAEAALLEAGRDAFRKGWVNAAKWAQRDDLLADIGSPAYVTEREAALNGGQDDA